MSTSSVDAAACLGLTRVRTGAGFRGADGGTTWKPCIQREQRAERVGATNSPQMEKVRGVQEEEGVGDYNESCTVLPNTKQLITAQKMCQLS